MDTMWILTANSSFAKIFEVKGQGRKVKEILHLDFPNGRKKSGEILSDRPGRAFDRLGSTRHALGTEVDVHEHQHKIFAHQLATILHEAYDKNSYKELALVAPPQFLGELKHAVSDAVRKSITKEIGKDLPEYLSEKERIDHLCKYLNLWNQASSSA